MRTIIIVTALLSVLSSCNRDNSWQYDSIQIAESLPPNHSNLKGLGNGWVQFDLDGRHFLYRRSGYVYSITECLTEIK